MNVRELLAAPPSPEVAEQLISWARSLPARIVRGDMMIGILGVDEVSQAPAALRRAAECGIDSAWLDLAMWLADPPYGEPDLPAAERVLEKALGDNVPGAVLLLVKIRWFLRRDSASAEEQRQAFKLLSDHVAQHPDDAEAIYLLGLLLCGGFGTQAAPARAFDLQQKSAALGNADALFETYVHLQTGLGVARDDAAAFRANEKAAEAGHSRAMFNMGAFFATGQHVERDLARAAEWYQRASNAGHARATATLGVMYATGEGVSKDTEYARELLDQAEYMGFDTTALREAVGLE